MLEVTFAHSPSDKAEVQALLAGDLFERSLDKVQVGQVRWVRGIGARFIPGGTCSVARLRITSGHNLILLFFFLRACLLVPRSRRHPRTLWRYLWYIALGYFAEERLAFWLRGRFRLCMEYDEDALECQELEIEKALAKIPGVRARFTVGDRRRNRLVVNCRAKPAIAIEVLELLGNQVMEGPKATALLHDAIREVDPEEADTEDTE